MTSFSERLGYKLPPIDLDESEMPESLVNGLWDVISQYCLGSVYAYSAYKPNRGYSPEFERFTRMFWFEVLRRPLDTRPDDAGKCYAALRDYFFSTDFYNRYDLLERAGGFSSNRFEFYRLADLVLKREGAAFRFIDGDLVKVVDPIEIEAISEAIEISPSGAVSEHIRRALALYSDLEAPDYRNSIKESISAVEAAARFVSGESLSGVSRSLQKFFDDQVLHPSLRQGFEKIYAYTSDASGIRHSLLDDGRVATQEDAKYMLVSCSAFSNYLLALAARK